MAWLIKQSIPLAIVLLTGCSDPSSIATAFHQALAQKDGEKAYGLLSNRTKDLLQKRSQTAFQASDGHIPDDPSEMIVQGDQAFYSEVTNPIATKTLTASYLSLSDTLAKVKIVVGDHQEELTLVHEDSHWRVDLPLATP